MRRPSVVVLGMLTKMPVAGVVWQTIHYLLGFERLGYESWYVEAHGVNPAMFQRHEGDPGSESAANFIATTLARFGLGGRWAYQALHADGRVWGMSEADLQRLYRSADLIVNLHGGTPPRSEHAAHDRLVYLETDPGALQIELYDGRADTFDYLEPHSFFFTFGESYGSPGCELPVTDRFEFRPTRQPVVLALWDGLGPPGTAFTTVANWRQRGRGVRFNGEEYRWSKDLEFRRFLGLPARTKETFELALSNHRPADEERLAKRGWRVRTAAETCPDPEGYRAYIAASMAEFTVAKDRNVRLRTGWFSDRSATYLAAGRPVIAQDTAFGDHLPVGEGLLPFNSFDEAVAAVEAVAADPGRHGRAATDIAREYFDSDAVLGRLLTEVGL